MKPSELILVLQEAVEAGLDDDTEILFDTEARQFDYHMAKIGRAYLEVDSAKAMDIEPFIVLYEER